MPLPNAPTRRPNNPASRQSDNKANRELLLKAFLLILIGLGVLLWPTRRRWAGLRWFWAADLSRCM